MLAFDDVILSRAPLVSSARNQFRGRVTGIEPAPPLLRVAVDCGIPITTYISGAAAKELQIGRGAEVVATFKASAVRLY